MKIIVLNVFMLIFTTLALAGPTLHSTIKIEKKGNKAFFIIVPNKDFAVNKEGPWKLELKTNQEIYKFEKTEFKAKDLDMSIPGFQTTFALLKKEAIKGEETVGTYKFVAFICTKDKKQCFRDVHQGSFF